MLTRRHFLNGTCAGIATMLTARAVAQPAGKVVRVVVPLPAGGATDVIARLLADALRSRYAPTIIVENRVGAGGRIGVESVRNGDADGSLMLFTPDFPITLYPHLYKKMPYEPRDFAPVALCAVTSMAIAAGPALPEPVRTIGDFVQWCKANPKSAAYASPATGSTPHFAGMMLSRASALELLHVPYKGGAQAVQDLMGGQVPVAIIPLGEILQHVKAGKLRVLATTGPTRSRFLPEIPTLVDAGYNDLVVQSWIGMLAPAATPANVVAKLNGDLMEALKDTKVTETLARFGFEVSPLAPAAHFSRVVSGDLDRWAAVTKATGFTAEE
jgi:tripartite-type tricarboxylate transporter receptor subunit TctC